MLICSWWTPHRIAGWILKAFGLAFKPKLLSYDIVDVSSWLMYGYGNTLKIHSKYPLHSSQKKKKKPFASLKRIKSHWYLIGWKGMMFGRVYLGTIKKSMSLTNEL